MFVALLALFIAASGVAVATIPANGTITACYDKKTGGLRAIDAATQSCRTTEAQLTWKDGSTLLGKTDKAADSDKLDGNNSTAFLASSGAYVNQGHIPATTSDTDEYNSGATFCSEGEVAVGGGVEPDFPEGVGSPQQLATITKSFPVTKSSTDPTPIGWIAYWSVSTNAGTHSKQPGAQIYVTCVKPGSPVSG